jgi:phosphoribosylformylglycinamidine cyclo-ligase
VDEESLLGPDRVEEGDVLVGLASSGLHANGYSLVRSAVLPGFDLAATPPGLERPLADELLEPCAIYAPDVVALANDGVLHAAAHVTGGGIVENLPRALPEGLGATLTRGSWPEHPIFRVIQEAAGASDADMFATFNMGIGMVLVVAPDQAPEVLRRNAHEAFPMGEVMARSGVRVV